MTTRRTRFVVHEHKAARLHYDFRLEIGGVLKSWAIPKGPSLNPSEKRLAVMVPDHVIEYIDFEGIIPEGSYGAGPVVVWDKGEYNAVDEDDDPEKAIAKGKITFEMRGKKLKGIFTLARMKGLPKSTGKEWLLIKKKDAYSRDDYSLTTELTPARLKKLRERRPPCDTE